MARILEGGPPRGRRVSAALHDAGERARLLVREAEEAARRLRADAEADRARVQAEAADVGHAEGLARAAAALVEAAAARDRLLAQAEQEVVRLAIDVAAKILGHALETCPSLVVEAAARAVRAARDRREVALRVHPADAAAVRAASGRLERHLSRASGIVIREDPSLERGGLIVETEAGRVDARFETQLAFVRRALLVEEER